MTEAPLLQEIDESKSSVIFKSEQEVMKVLRIGSLKVDSNIILQKVVSHCQNIEPIKRLVLEADFDPCSAFSLCGIVKLSKTR